MVPWALPPMKMKKTSASEKDQNPEPEAGEQEVLPDAVKFQELPAQAAEVMGPTTVKNVTHVRGDAKRPFNCNQGAPDGEELDQGRLAFWFLRVRAGEPEDSGADPRHEEPVDLEREVVCAPDGEGKDAARAEPPRPHEINRANDACECLNDESERGEAEELVASSLSWADNLVLHVLRGERLQIPLVFFFVGFNLELAIDEECDEQGQEENDHREQAPCHDICGGNALLGGLQRELRRGFGHLALVMLNDADGHHMQGLGSAIWATL